MLTESEQEQRKYARGEWAKFVRTTNFVYPRVCSHCGEEGFIEAHHPNYSKPLEIIFLCRSCHRLVDGYNRRKRWADIRQGKLAVSRHIKMVRKLGLDDVDDLVDFLVFIIKNRTQNV